MSELLRRHLYPLMRIYTHDQGGVERGFAFLKDQLFLASSVFVKKWLCRQRHLIG